MASLKDLKKDINYLVDEVIGTCLLHQYTQKKEKQEEIDNLIEEMIDFREKLIYKVNHPEERENNQSKKAYYRSLFEDLLEEVNQAFEKLNEITR